MTKFNRVRIESDPTDRRGRQGQDGVFVRVWDRETSQFDLIFVDRQGAEILKQQLIVALTYLEVKDVKSKFEIEQARLVDAFSKSPNKDESVPGTE